MSAAATRYGWTRTCIKQSLGSQNCVACVAGMITEMPLAYVHDWLNIPDGEPAYDHELFAYLYAHQIALCHGFKFDFVKLEGCPTRHSLDLRLNWRLEGQAAYLGVRSTTNPQWTHAVLWNGEEVLDPNPLVGQLPLSEYEIQEIVPIYRLRAPCRWVERLTLRGGGPGGRP